MMRRTVVGRRLADPIGADEPLDQLRARRRDGRAGRVHADRAASTRSAGELQPGDRVTVLATFTTANGGATTRAVASELLVLAVGQVPRLGDPSHDDDPGHGRAPRPGAREPARARELGREDRPPPRTPRRATARPRSRRRAPRRLGDERAAGCCSGSIPAEEEAISDALYGGEGLSVVASGADTRELLALAETQPAEAVLLSAGLPGLDTAQVARLRA